MPKPPLPMVTFALARPFASELERRNLDYKPLLRQVGLEPSNLFDDDVFIGAQSWYDFASLAAQKANNTELGYQIGANHAVDTLPNLKVLELPMATLGELLTALVIDVQRFSTIAKYRLETDGARARLSTERSFLPARPPSQIDGYFAGFMVRILSMCSGDRWQPDALSFRVCDVAAIPERIRADCRVGVGELSGASFEFPAVWLLHRTDGMSRQNNLSEERASDEFIDSFRALLDLNLSHQSLSLARFAKLTSQSEHVLKRRLRAAGTTYQTELDKRRASLARLLLQSTNENVAQIGERLGYPDPPSFNRAFKRWTSQSPLVFRREHRERSTKDATQ